RFGPTTPTRPSSLPLTPRRLDWLSCCRTSFSAERVSPSARERVPIRLLYSTPPRYRATTPWRAAFPFQGVPPFRRRYPAVYPGAVMLGAAPGHPIGRE